MKALNSHNPDFNLTIVALACCLMGGCRNASADGSGPKSNSGNQIKSNISTSDTNPCKGLQEKMIKQCEAFKGDDKKVCEENVNNAGYDRLPKEACIAALQTLPSDPIASEMSTGGTNAKIAEASSLLKLFRQDKKEYFERIAQHKQDINEALEAIQAGQRENKDPQWVIGRIKEFAAKCSDFVSSIQPLTADAVYSNRVHDHALAKEVLGYLENVNELILLSRTFMSARDVIIYLNTQLTAKVEPQPSYVAIQPDAAPPAAAPAAAKTDGQPKEGEPAPEVKPWRIAKLISAMTPPKPIQDANGRVTGHKSEVHVVGQKQPQTLDAKQIVEFDGAPLIQDERNTSLRMLVQFIYGLFYGLREAANDVDFESLEKRLEENAAK